MTGRVVTDLETDWSRYDGCMRLKVVGESYYQPSLTKVSHCPRVGAHGYECGAELVPDPANEFDKNAVRVEIDGELVGHLPRGSAKRFGKRLRELRERGRPTVCMAFIGRGDGGNPNLGVTLHIPYDCEILQGRS